MPRKALKTDNPVLTSHHMEDIKLAASKMGVVARRSFQAAIAKQYCGGSPRLAERWFGWSRRAVELGLHEQRTGITCLSIPHGDKLWEHKHPKVAEALWRLAQAHAQQDPSFRTTLSYTRLTVVEALKQLRAQGFPADVLPAPSTMAEVLNRNGYRLRAVVKAKPQKNSRKRMLSLTTSERKMDNVAKARPSSA